MTLDENKKILLIVHSLNGKDGGLEIAFSRLETNLPDSVKRRIVIFKNIVNLPHKGKISIINEPKLPRFFLIKKKALYPFTFFLGFIILFYRILRLRKLITEDIKKIVAFDHYFGFIATLASRGKSVDIIVSLHTTTSIQFKINPLSHLLPDLFYTKIIFPILRKKVKFHTVSDYLKKDLMKNFNIDPHRIITIYNVIDENEIKKKSLTIPNDIPKENYFITIANFKKEKNHKELLIAFKLLRENGFGYKLVLIGDGYLLTSIKQFAKKLNIYEHILFMGRRENPFPYLSNSKLFLLTSEYEALPQVVIESVILKVPVVSYNSPGGISEIIVNPVEMNPENVYKEAKKILIDKQYGKYVVDANYKIYLENHRKKITVSKWINLLEL